MTVLRAVGVIAALFAVPATAQAGTVTFDGVTATYTASAGGDNVQLGTIGAVLSIESNLGVSGGCPSMGLDRVECAGAAAARVVLVDGADNNVDGTQVLSAVTLTAVGSGTDDRLTGTRNADALSGGAGGDNLDGGEGATARRRDGGGLLCRRCRQRRHRRWPGQRHMDRRGGDRQLQCRHGGRQRQLLGPLRQRHGHARPAVPTTVRRESGTTSAPTPSTPTAATATTCWWATTSGMRSAVARATTRSRAGPLKTGSSATRATT